MSSANAQPEARPTTGAIFLSGSTMRHVVTMTLTGAFGLMAMFFVDLIDLFYLSLLGKTEITAAIGFAGTLAFVNLALSIGTGIAAAALVSRNLGAGLAEDARHLATNCTVFALAISLVIASSVALNADSLLRLLGARGRRWNYRNFTCGSYVPALRCLVRPSPSVSSCVDWAMRGGRCTSR